MGNSNLGCAETAMAIGSIPPSDFEGGFLIVKSPSFVDAASIRA